MNEHDCCHYGQNPRAMHLPIMSLKLSSWLQTDISMRFACVLREVRNSDVDESVHFMVLTVNKCLLRSYEFQRLGSLNGIERHCVLDRVIARCPTPQARARPSHGAIRRSITALCDSGTITVRLSREIPQTGSRPGLREVSAISPIK